ncbi:MAG: hypothetical protein HKO85_10355 [Xanthomonadales bacterium]|nr:hypothetical protein [Gammaproteobacteria bacterium]MBT8050927.1 hypothetical protein [Gammaproteobacteria bacterium]MBT8057299.1 hypothetical protein [Gammaproteobacteria bacterium]NNJ78663.1 hypothetical protein [Xanthomonadales bacterium]NNL05677.1 hypothetical protein [Xanthomonadales bacterium]
MSGQHLLLVSRRDLIQANDGPEADRLIRALASLTRQGFHFVATASQPDEWSRRRAESKRSRRGPRRLRDRLAEAGGVLDGVYYIPHSLLTQRARREEAIGDLLERFGTKASDCYLVTTNKKFIAAAKKFGVKAQKVNNINSLCKKLESLAETMGTA